MRFSFLGMLQVPLLALGLAGCVSGGSQFENTLYNTHSIVARLDKNIQGSVEKLNQTSAELSAKADATDQSVKTLQTTMEENTRRLAAVDKKLESLIRGLNRGVQITPPTENPIKENAAPSTTEPTPPAPIPSTTESQTPPPAPVASTETPVAPPTPSVAPAEPARSSDGEKADFIKARESYTASNFAVAAQQFDAFVKTYPKSDNAANAMFWKSKALLSLKNYNDAIQQFEQFRANYPSHPRVPYAITAEGQCYAGLGQKAKAQELFNDVLKNYPGSAAADLVKGELKNLQGN